ncbi:MAG: hypothetical protein ACOYKD_09265 [Anaerolineaceae bacterium]|jgi:hypothetical protein
MMQTILQIVRDFMDGAFLWIAIGLVIAFALAQEAESQRPQ